MFLSDFIKNGATFQGKAGPLAIAVGDLLGAASKPPLLYPVQNTDYATVNSSGTQIVGLKTVGVKLNNADSDITFNTRKATYVNPVDGSIFVGCAISGLNGTGMTVTKYSATGAIIDSVILQAAGSVVTVGAAIVGLSNGNIAASWGGATNVQFAIFDANLNIITATTTTGLLANGTLARVHDIIALSGGGFALVGYTGSGTPPGLAIYNNVGTPVLSTTQIPSVSAARVALVQLSNGNIAVAISAVDASKTLGFAIFTAAGVSVVAYTIANAATITTNQTPEISAMPGFFCIAHQNDAQAVAYVYNNAGALQGAPYVEVRSHGATLSQKLVNDGSNFWFFHGYPTGAVARIPSSGTNFTTTDLVGFFGTNTDQITSDAFMHRGQLVYYSSGVIFIAQIDPTTKVPNFSSWNLTQPNFVQQLIPTFDFSFVVVGYNSLDHGTKGGAQQISVYKFLDFPIVGISQNALAAGNQGTLITTSFETGVFSINALLGSSISNFSSQTARGTLMQNTVIFRGPRNIN